MVSFIQPKERSNRNPLQKFTYVAQPSGNQPTIVGHRRMHTFVGFAPLQVQQSLQNIT